jgi:hypothetical protein
MQGQRRPEAASIFKAPIIPNGSFPYPDVLECHAKRRQSATRVRGGADRQQCVPARGQREQEEAYEGVFARGLFHPLGSCVLLGRGLVCSLEGDEKSQFQGKGQGKESKDSLPWPLNSLFLCCGARESPGFLAKATKESTSKRKWRILWTGGRVVRWC